jgi:hypothetical protein
MCWNKLDNSVQCRDGQSVFFPAAFVFIHLALVTAAVFTRAAALRASSRDKIGSEAYWRRNL